MEDPRPLMIVSGHDLSSSDFIIVVHSAEVSVLYPHVVISSPFND
jgi:hypothetical protein